MRIFKLFILAGLLLPSTSVAEVVMQTLEPSSSSIAFTFNSNFLNLTGSFKKFDGQVALDLDDVTRSKVNFSMIPTSAEFDQRPEMFDLNRLVESLPPTPVTFRSTSIRRTGPQKYRVEGTVQYRAQLRKLTVPVEIVSATGKQSSFVISFAGPLDDDSPYVPPVLSMPGSQGSIRGNLRFVNRAKK